VSAENYDACLAVTLDFEGGYSNDPGDPGGPTKYGITINDVRKYLNPHASASDVRALALAQAKTIYRLHYWLPIHGDQLPKGVDLAVFDYGVNSGIYRCARILQGFIGAKRDGIIGTQTLDVVNAIKPSELPNLVAEICDERLTFLKQTSHWRLFGRGWSRRVAAIKKIGMKMAKTTPTGT